MPKKTEDKQDLLSILRDATDSYDSGEDLLSKVTDWVSTGSLVADAVIGGGRAEPCTLIPFGRQVEVAGKEHAGKTTLCAMVAKKVQDKDGLVIIVDTEDRIDEEYWTKIGVDLNKILHIKARTLEDVFNQQYKMIQIIKKNHPDTPTLMIWDSLGGTRLGSILDGANPDDVKKNPIAVAKRRMGEFARVIGIGMELLNPEIADSNICYMYTNHLYSKLDGGYGDPFETYGGQKLKYFATVRLRLSRIGNITVENELGNKITIGARIAVESLKNSMTPNLMRLEGCIIGGKGFNNDYTVWEAAATLKLYASGPWSTWTTPKGEEVKFQGWKGFQDKVVTHPEYESLVNAVKAKLQSV